MKHKFLKNNKQRYSYGIEMRECSCGVWRSYEPDVKEQLSCYESGERKQMTSEALAQLRQSIRNLGYTLTMVPKKELNMSTTDEPYVEPPDRSKPPKPSVEYPYQK